MTEAGPIWKNDAENAIRRLPGVVGAHIRMHGDEIGAIFVQTDGSRDSRRFVRDVEAILATTGGVEVDYRKISVAATPPLTLVAAEGRPAAEAPPRRPAFENVRLNTSGLRTEAQVELSLGDTHVLGSAEGPATRGSVLDLVAEACLNATAQFIDEPVSFSPGGLERVRVGRDEVMVVLVRFIQGRSEKALTGSSPCEQDDLRSATYATLDAINRIFSNLKHREAVEYVLEAEVGADL
jgi:hypothetical protein